MTGKNYNDKEVEKNIENAHSDSENFSLYTEKIVVNPFVRYKKIFAAIKFIVLAIIFGLIASIVMALTYPLLVDRGDKPEKGKDALVLNKDEFPSDAIMDETDFAEENDDVPTKPGVTKPTQEEELMSYSELVEKIQKSVVVITSTSHSKTELPVTGTEEPVGEETVGVIIGVLSGRYLVLTSNTAINTYEENIVRIGDNTEVKADFVSVDKETDLALISFPLSEITDYEKTLIAPAQLDNSYIVKQGDAFIAAGKLYGKVKSVDKGFITGVTSESGIDNCYGLINTGIRAMVGDYCFLFNTEGNVIGISKLVDEKDKFVANGISDFKSMIEKLSSDSDIIYLGIKGTHVTASMATKYNLPYGVFVSDVIIDSPAFSAGIQAGDVITRFNGETILTMQRFSEKLYSCSSGQEISLVVKRPGMTDYKELEFKASLTTR